MSQLHKKLSYYTIFTDEIGENNSSRIIFSTRSARAVVVSKRVYNALLQNQWQKLSKTLIANLIKEGILVDEEENELSKIIDENKKFINDDTVLYQVIQPSAMCQLGCDYCGQDHKKVNIKDELIEKLILRYRQKLVQRPNFYSGIFIAWFGGEPLMALREIRILTQKLKELALEFKISYGAKIVTNGLSLKPTIFRELALDLDIRSMEITLDGTAEYHDVRRITKEGYDTFDIIFKNLTEIFGMPDYSSLGCSISIRCNVDKRNYLGVTPLIKKMADNDFNKFITNFYVASVYSWGNDAHLKSFSKEEFSEMEIDWMVDQYQHGFMPNLLPSRVKTVCLAVNPSNEMVDAYGNLFNCTEVSYVDVYKDTSYVLGNVKFDRPDEEYKDRPLVNWNDEILDNKFQCNSCKMLPVCGGGCPKSWHEDMRACPTNKFNIKEKLLLSYVLTKSNIKEVTA
ncbi:radical SAM protein [Mucilaginibacter sp.]|uniref:radical SAM/SPASM domain-containing protein n=1 Tax=Mucilaginibacter sp. TaxID=1882438 RepID=UPI0025CEC95E|nr:radical SAM protein [Mucilaginibacter sp.]